MGLKRKVYYCCVCHKTFNNSHPIRLVKQLHDEKETYGAYHNERNYDFCNDCFRALMLFLKKRRDELVGGEKNGKM